MKIVLLLSLLAAVIGVGWPLASGAFGGGGEGNEATRLVDATDRTQIKADAVSRSYNDVIPPAISTPANMASRQAAAAQARRSSPQARNPVPAPGAPGVAPGGMPAGAVQPEITPEPTIQLTPGEHAVADAMAFLNRVHTELHPSDTEYIRAVNRLKRAWSPRYTRAVDEYRRFEDRVAHAEEMAFEYLEIQQRLTYNINDSQIRESSELRDAQEQRVVLDWINKANDVLAQARAIKIDLDDMNLIITKLELSATFASVYEGFMKMPIAITMLNTELERFQEESERIYETFGPKAE